jgi:hypothetical protein
VEDHHVDRLGVEVQQCMQLTSTNRLFGLIPSKFNSSTGLNAGIRNSKSRFGMVQRHIESSIQGQTDKAKNRLHYTAYQEISLYSCQRTNAKRLSDTRLEETRFKRGIATTVLFQDQQHKLCIVTNNAYAARRPEDAIGAIDY